jgi:hypothetical protein
MAQHFNAFRHIEMRPWAWGLRTGLAISGTFLPGEQTFRKYTPVFNAQGDNDE